MRRTPPLLALVATIAAVLVAVTLPGSTASATVSRGPAPQATPASPATPAAPAPPAATKVVYVRPVTVSGRPAAGWSVTRESGTVTCDGTAPSSVNPGIASCYPTAYGLRACFGSARHTVLCVRDPHVKELVRIRYSGAYPVVEGPRTPQPAALDLADGRTCLLRVGGAWSSPAQHPQWVGFDSCSRKADVYGSGNGDGLDRSSRAWTVKMWRYGPDPDGRRLVTRRVTRAYVVGVAAA